MDQLLQMIQSADPTDNQSDSVELLQLEGKLDLRNMNYLCVCKDGLLLARKYKLLFFHQVLAIKWDPSLTSTWRI